MKLITETKFHFLIIRPLENSQQLYWAMPETRYALCYKIFLLAHSVREGTNFLHGKIRYRHSKSVHEFLIHSGNQSIHSSLSLFSNPPDNKCKSFCFQTRICELCWLLLIAWTVHAATNPWTSKCIKEVYWRNDHTAVITLPYTFIMDKTQHCLFLSEYLHFQLKTISKLIFSIDTVYK